MKNLSAFSIVGICVTFFGCNSLLGQKQNFSDSLTSAVTPNLVRPILNPVVSPFNIEGTEVPQLAALDTEVTSYMTQYEIPSATLAVMRNGTLIYARGFGNLAAGGTHTPAAALMRIASVTKPIAAAIAVNLYLQGRLSPDTRVFPYLGITPFGGSIADPRLIQITVHDLICHQGGWDISVPGATDPDNLSILVAELMGVPSPANPTQMASFMMSQPLQHSPEPYPLGSDPGQCDSNPSWYFNFGYNMLGLVLEKATGQPFIDLVQNMIFTPLMGNAYPISAYVDMGETFQSQFSPYEVTQYSMRPFTLSPDVYNPSVEVETPYGGWSQPYSMAAGGLIASAPALVQFAQNYWFYGDPRNGGEGYIYWKSGGAAGTTASLVWNPWNSNATATGVNMALLMNQSGQNGVDYGTLTTALNSILANTTNWPTAAVTAIPTVVQ